jgi:hypothetical protein
VLQVVRPCAVICADFFVASPPPPPPIKIAASRPRSSCFAWSSERRSGWCRWRGFGQPPSQSFGFGVQGTRHKAHIRHKQGTRDARHKIQEREKSPADWGVRSLDVRRAADPAASLGQKHIFACGHGVIKTRPEIELGVLGAPPKFDGAVRIHVITPNLCLSHGCCWLAGSARFPPPPLTGRCRAPKPQQPRYRARASREALSVAK